MLEARTKLVLFPFLLARVFVIHAQASGVRGGSQNFSRWVVSQIHSLGGGGSGGDEEKSVSWLNKFSALGVGMVFRLGAPPMGMYGLSVLFKTQFSPKIFFKCLATRFLNFFLSIAKLKQGGRGSMFLSGEN